MRRLALLLAAAALFSAAICQPIDLRLPATFPVPPPPPDVVMDNLMTWVTDPLLGPIAATLGVALGRALAEAFDTVTGMLTALLEALQHFRHFPGTGCNVWFTADDGNPLGVWRPGMPIAVGAPLRLEAVDLVARGGELPDTVPTVEPPELFVEVSAERNLFRGRAAAPGTARVAFTGPTSDAVDVEIRATAKANFMDPVQHVAALLALGLGPRLAPFWPDVGDDVVMAPGASLLLRPRLLDAAGESLYFRADDFEVGAGQEVIVTPWRVVGVVVNAGATAGENQALALHHRGEELGALRVSTAAPGAVTQLSAEVHGEPGACLYWVHVTAALPDGTKLWQAPVEWDVDAGLERWDLLGELGSPLSRTDLALVRVLPPGTTAETRQVRLRLGVLETAVSIQVPARPPPPAPSPPPSRSRGCAEASAVVSTPSLSALLLVIAALRARRRR
ncbi:MAG: hypothetical protein HY904_21890 [Deltaproteobacteria bacterium]|nr:hypothetical protein [Deltaproteobacteria bacterium]